MRKLSVWLLSIFMMTGNVYSDPEDEPAEETAEEITEETAEESSEEETYAVDIHAEYAALLDLDSGTVLFEKNADQEADPASLTKLMTVYLASVHLTDSSLTMSDSAFQSYDHNQGVLWIQLGETLSVADCEYATMLASANDTCAMLAEGVSNNIESFVSKMNSTASELGLEHTRFDNPFGLSSEGNYSSAKDMAELTRRAMKNETFRTVFGASSYTIRPTNMQGQSRVIANDCELLRQEAYYNPQTIGGKIGSTASGYALSAVVQKGETSLVAVVLEEATADDAYRDVEALMEYGFSMVQTVTITPEEIGVTQIEVKDGKKEIAVVEFRADSAFSVLMPREVNREDLQAEVVVTNEDSLDPERISAEVIFTLDGEQIGSSPMDRTILFAPEEESKSRMEQIQMVFDDVCLVLLGMMILGPLALKIFRTLQPPK
ncbi:MAG: D-alanyl-D-alanine carboxypeptidase [Solobacterium sp.]|nr:D-alanyl-D-alanine carboxypeptidase [Solobacterium sp.]